MTYKRFQLWFDKYIKNDYFDGFNFSPKWVDAAQAIWRLVNNEIKEYKEIETFEIPAGNWRKLKFSVDAKAIGKAKRFKLFLKEI
jgi:hypothetical protein